MMMNWNDYEFIDDGGPQIEERRLVFLPAFWRFFATGLKTVNLIYGGAGSGKSYNVALYLILLALTEDDKEFLVVRKTGPSLRLSCYKLIVDLLRANGIPFEENRSDRVIVVSSSRFWFRPADDVSKLKSSEFNYIWIEEANELTYDDYLMLRLRLRRKGGSFTNPQLSFRKTINRMFLTFNPVNVFSWLKTEILDKRNENIGVLRVNYKDNPFLSNEYVKTLVRLKNQNEDLYKIYALGEWATPSDLIYTNWEVIDESEYPFEDDNRVYGLDFGYNNPTALVEVIFGDDAYYIREVLYCSALTNNDLINELKRLLEPGSVIYADSAEPARIEEINRAGFLCLPAKKDVKFGIDMVKRKKLRICAGSVNLLKEISAYSYLKTKDGIITDEPVKFNDHAMDAMRYAIASAVNRGDVLLW